MKAAILYGQEDVRVEDINPPALNPGEVRIRIEAALTCGTDLKVFKRGYHAKMIVPPAVFGHELAGVIQEVRSAKCEVRSDGGPVSGASSQVPDAKGQVPGAKSQVSGIGDQGSGSAWRVGDRVVAANSAPCGDCFYCRHQQENLCDDLVFLNGAYAESIVVPARIAQKNLLRLKAGTAFRDAALVEPLACVVHGIEDANLSVGQQVLVLGAGPIGLMFVALARHLGCEVTVAGRRAARLDAAQKLGARQVIDIGDGRDLVAKIRGASPTPFDVVVEAVGGPEVWEACVSLVRKGGTVNFFGGCPAGTSIRLDTTQIHYSNLTLLASFHHTPRAIRRALDFIEAGLIQAADFVDGECALSRLPQLFQSMTAGHRFVKTLIRVRE